MNTQQQMEERLWDYIDGLSSPAERSAIEELVAANIEWQQKYRELLGVHQLMNSTELEAPSMRFTKNVMEEIARYQNLYQQKYHPRHRRLFSHPDHRIPDLLPGPIQMVTGNR